MITINYDEPTLKHGQTEIYAIRQASLAPKLSVLGIPWALPGTTGSRSVMASVMAGLNPWEEPWDIGIEISIIVMHYHGICQLILTGSGYIYNYIYVCVNNIHQYVTKII